MRILYSAEEIGDEYGASLNAAFSQLRAESGITPVVLRPYGGDRTLAEQRFISPAVGNPASSDHVKRRAVDIDNHRALRNWNQARFLAVMRGHGWQNIDLSGRPFPSEPWHFATRTAAAASSTIQPIDTTPKDTDMIERRLLRQEGTIGVYKQVNNTLTPVIDEEQLVAEQAGFRALAAAGDAFLSQVGSTLADVIVVKDMRRAGVKLGESTWNPSAEQLAAIGAAVPVVASDTAVIAAMRELARQADADHAATLAAISTIDEQLLAALGLQRIPA